MESTPPPSPLQHIRAYLGEHAGTKLSSQTDNITSAVDLLEPNSPFHQLSPESQELLAKFVTNIVKRIEHESEIVVFNGIAEIAEALDHASGDALRLTTQGWAGRSAIQLCLRHEATVVENLVQEFSTHPMLSAHRCRTLISHSTADPRYRLSKTVAYFEAARTKHSIWHLSNDAIHKTVSFQDMLDGNFEPLIAAENTLQQPLSALPSEALTQLRSNQTQLSTTRRIHKATVEQIQRSVHKVITTSPSIIARCAEMGVATDEIEDISAALAAYTETFDCTAATSASLIAVVHHYLEQTSAMQEMDIPTPVALRAALFHSAAYCAEFIAKAKAAELSTSAIRTLLKNYTSNPKDYLDKMLKLSEDMEAADPDMPKSSRLIIAQKTMGSRKTGKAVIEDHHANIATARLLFGGRLSEGFIRRTCVAQPIGCLKSIGKAHALAEELYTTHNDPCMPEGFIQELVEKTSNKTIKARLEAYKNDIAALRTEHTEYSNAELWAIVHARHTAKES